MDSAKIEYDLSLINSISDMLLLLSVHFLIFGIILGILFSKYTFHAIDSIFRRPNRIKLHDGTYLYRYRNVYLTLEQLKSKIKQNSSSI